jgi:hypothetical protein
MIRGTACYQVYDRVIHQSYSHPKPNSIVREGCFKKFNIGCKMTRIYVYKVEAILTLHADFQGRSRNFGGPEQIIKLDP